jgi:opacity protein-like surface antigen
MDQAFLFHKCSDLFVYQAEQQAILAISKIEGMFLILLESSLNEPGVDPVIRAALRRQRAHLSNEMNDLRTHLKALQQIPACPPPLKTKPVIPGVDPLPGDGGTSGGITPPPAECRSPEEEISHLRAQIEMEKQEADKLKEEGQEVTNEIARLEATIPRLQGLQNGNEDPREGDPPDPNTALIDVENQIKALKLEEERLSREEQQKRDAIEADKRKLSGLTGEPCPPPNDEGSMYVPWNGPFFGVQLAGSVSGAETNEYLASTGMRTNAFNDRGGGIGGGFNFGWNWQPWGNNVVVGVTLDANILNDAVKHSFAGGTSIGSTVSFTASAMARAGVLATPNLLIFAQSGVSIANQNLKIAFGGPVTKESQITPGFSLGAGAEWMMPTSLLSGLGPTSLFVDYAHTWWGNAQLNMPAASPLFDYTWMRQSDVVKAGFRVRFLTK